MLTLRKEKKYLIHFSFKFKELKFCTVFMNWLHDDWFSYIFIINLGL
jgi:hypothetical protein